MSKPNQAVDLLTIRFVTGGRMIRRDPGVEFVASAGHAMCVSFDTMLAEEASASFEAVGGTITRAALTAANDSLEGRHGGSPPELEPVVPVEALPMRVLLGCFEALHRRLSSSPEAVDLALPLLEEAVAFQVLSCWPRRDAFAAASDRRSTAAIVKHAMECIHAIIEEPFKLSEVAATVGVSVRTLQKSFRVELGITPIGYVIDLRLRRVRDEISAPENKALPIGVLARRWGFTHMGDFGRRFRAHFGCTPSEARR